MRESNLDSFIAELKSLNVKSYDSRLEDMHRRRRATAIMTLFNPLNRLDYERDKFVNTMLYGQYYDFILNYSYHTLAHYGDKTSNYYKELGLLKDKAINELLDKPNELVKRHLLRFKLLSQDFKRWWDLYKEMRDAGERQKIVLETKLLPYFLCDTIPHFNPDPYFIQDLHDAVMLKHSALKSMIAEIEMVVEPDAIDDLKKIHDTKIESAVTGAMKKGQLGLDSFLTIDGRRALPYIINNYRDKKPSSGLTALLFALRGLNWLTTDIIAKGEQTVFHNALSQELGKIGSRQALGDSIADYHNTPDSRKKRMIEKARKELLECISVDNQMNR